MTPVHSPPHGEAEKEVGHALTMLPSLINAVIARCVVRVQCIFSCDQNTDVPQSISVVESLKLLCSQLSKGSRAVARPGTETTAMLREPMKVVSQASKVDKEPTARPDAGHTAEMPVESEAAVGAKTGLWDSAPGSATTLLRSSRSAKGHRNSYNTSIYAFHQLFRCPSETLGWQTPEHSEGQRAAVSLISPDSGDVET